MKAQLLSCLALLVGIIPAATFFWQFRDIPTFGHFRDDAVYVETGKAITTGQGYRMLHLPGKPFQVKYPPVYPLLIAVVWWILPSFPANLSGMAALNLLALALASAASMRLYHMFGLSRRVSMGLAAFLVCIPAYVYLACSVMTEMVFIAVLLWAVVVLEHSEDTRSCKWAAVAGALSSLAYLTRTAAAPLLFTAPACFLIRNRYRHAVAFAASSIPFVTAWQIWSTTHKATALDWTTRFYMGYSDMERLTVSLDNLATVAWINLDSILGSIGDMFIFELHRSGWWSAQLARLIAVAAIAGTARLMLSKARWHYAAFAAVYSGLMIFWHYPPDQRLFLPLAPLLLAGFWTECSYLMRPALRSMRGAKIGDQVIGAAFVAAILTLGLAVLLSTAKARLVDLPALANQNRKERSALEKAFVQVARLTPRNATILSDQDALLNLFTDRTSYRTIVPPRLFYPPQIERIGAEFASLPDMKTHPWDYLLVSRGDWDHTLDADAATGVRNAIRANPNLELIWSSPYAALYSRRCLTDAAVAAGVQPADARVLRQVAAR